MKIPRFIKPGDTIGFVAPSYGIGTEPYITRFEAAVRRLKDRGYKIKTCPSVFKADGIGISTDPKDAARDPRNAAEGELQPLRRLPAYDRSARYRACPL